MSKNALILYPNQLFAAEYLPKDVDQVIVVEDPLYFGTDQQYPMYIHKQKIVFMRSSMRRYIEEVLWRAGYETQYVEYHQINDSGDVVNLLNGFNEVVFFDFNDDRLARRIKSSIQALAHRPQIKVLDSPNFFLSSKEVIDAFNDKQKVSFESFYRWQRERFNILIDSNSYKPVGGELMFKEVPKRLPGNHQLPSFEVYGSNDFVDEAKDYVNKHFPDNPGFVEDMPWPTNSEEAYSWLEEFLATRIDNYSTYSEAIDGQAPWLYHSAISPMLNIGLLDPHKVIDKTLQRHEKNPIPISSLELFVREVIGWREYRRGMYLKKHVQFRTHNPFGHNRGLTVDWYNATTGILPVDDAIKKIQTRAYAHNVERMMIIRNAMFLADFHPDEIYRWFVEMNLDGYDWNMVPDIYGMNYSVQKGIFVFQPDVIDSTFILKMSHYEKGDWSDIWDGLYWRFVEKNHEYFAKNKKLKVVLDNLNKIPENRRRIIGYRAEDFLKEKTVI